jgi:hypothetical protein
METWVRIGEAVKEAVGVSAVAGALGAIDDSYNLVRSVVLGAETEPEPHPIAQLSLPKMSSGPNAFDISEIQD